MARQNVLTAAGALFAFLLVALIAVLGLPLVQAIGYNIFVQSPAFLWWLIIGAIGSGALLYTDHVNSAMAVGIVALVMALIVGPYMSSVYAQEHILDHQDFEEQATLENTSTEHVRILPRNVANSYAESANQLPQYATGQADIAYHNGTYAWSYPVEPGPLMVALQGHQWGAFYVNMEQMSRSVTTSHTTMQHGLGQLFIDSFTWQATAYRLDVEHKPSTTFVFEHNGKTHIARSYVTHDWHFELLPIPQPYVVPEYSGTLVMHPNGTITDYSPQEVAHSEMFKGQNTYPYDLARYRMTAMQLRNGLINKWFYQKGVPEIADTGGFSDNRQPFTVPTTSADGTPELTYYIAATPAGTGSGIYQIYTIDAQTGAIEYVNFEETQAGPKKAAGYTRSQNRAPNWAANNKDGSTQITEPIPVVLDGTLYWHMRVTPTDGSRVSYTTFVNANTGTVYRADTTAEIVSFIESGGPDTGDVNTGDDTQNASAGASFTVYVIENGSVVETFTVERNQTVVISPGNRTDNATATV